MNSFLAGAENFIGNHAAWIATALFSAMAVMAAVAVARPIWAKGQQPLAARVVLSAALGLFVIGLGGGTYLLLGTPQLAVRGLSAPRAGDVPGLIAELSWRMRDRPSDVTGWTLLGRGYLTLNDPSQAAVAFRHAAALAPEGHRSELLSSYGEALTLAAGTVTPEAQAAFRETLAENPKDFAARFYLGQAYADRRETAKARALWESLLADSPSNAAWRADLIDRLAALGMRSGPTPDIGAMVESLAERLRANPDDLTGWERLIRAYAVLGQKTQSRSAVMRARVVFAGDRDKLAAIETEVQSLGLEK